MQISSEITCLTCLPGTEEALYERHHLDSTEQVMLMMKMMMMMMILRYHTNVRHFVSQSYLYNLVLLTDASSSYTEQTNGLVLKQSAC